jgi:hypothetical protein
VPLSRLGTGKSLTFLYSVVRARSVEHSGRAGVSTTAWFGLANLIELLILRELLSEQGAGWVACNSVVWFGMANLDELLILRELLPEQGGLGRVQQHGLIWFG